MHTSFEDISDKDGHIYRMDENGKWIWERKRTRREAGIDRRVIAALIAGAIIAFPFAFAFILIITKT